MQSKSVLGLSCLMALSTLGTHVQAQDKPVRIGVIEDMSGVFADSSGKGSVVAAQLAVDDFGGAVLGRKVEVLSANHQNKADIAATRVRSWFDTEGVSMVTGLGNSAVAVAVRNITREAGKIDIVTTGASSDLTSQYCSPTGFHWGYDSYALGNAIATHVVKNGGDKWFFLTADYNFGAASQRDTSKFIEAAGGKVVGATKVPINSADMSSYVLAAQSSDAKIIALAMSGADLTNGIKTAAQFGTSAKGKKTVGTIIFITDIFALGLKNAEGLILASSYYWDADKGSRDFAQRFMAKMGKMPTMTQTSTYSAVNHYLKSMAAAGTEEGKTVAAKMRELPVNDFSRKNVRIREDGREMNDMYLFEVKSPAESKDKWDLYKKIGVVPGEQVYRPLAEGNCALAKK